MGNSVSLAPGNAASTSSGRPLIAREGSISYLIPGAYVAGNPISLAPSNASSTSSGRPLIGREVSISHLIPEAYVTHSTDDAKMIARAANSSRSSVAMPGSTQETSTRALPGRVSKRPRLSMVTVRRTPSY
ncbi:hypothetical protein FOMPIDRAFT_95006 [Fomitopsis schrenkii]|uniref:Uncharacterized protein n=1 Tax=Fomitopsis schrenkii TaxID=2126942 RepID=S8DT59_FOMSC|nr:hypothetical protein FOMPIDRAFT_95006 [Fomitopsis schrenkii]